VASLANPGNFSAALAVPAMRATENKQLAKAAFDAWIADVTAFFDAPTLNELFDRVPLPAA